MQNLSYGTLVKIKSNQSVGRVVRFYEKSEKYVVNVSGKLFTHTFNELKVIKTNLIKKLFIKLFK
jgi:hypothetical protein